MNEKLCRESMSRPEVIELVSHSKSIEELKNAILISNFNQLFSLKIITNDDIPRILINLSRHSLSLGVTFSQHMQSLYALIQCNINDFTEVDLICSATTTVKGSSLTAFVELTQSDGLLSRICPVVSFFSLASHILFTGKIADKPVLIFASTKNLNIQDHQFLHGLGMKENRISSVSFSLPEEDGLAITDNIQFILNEVIAYHAHYLWSICWNSTLRAMFNATLELTRDRITEPAFSRLNQLNNILVINDSLIMRLASINHERISHIDKHLVLNSAKIVISENASLGADLCLQSLGFKHGYMATQGEWFHHQYHDLKSAIYMFNNDSLYDINLKSIKLSFHLSGRKI